MWSQLVEESHRWEEKQRTIEQESRKGKVAQPFWALACLCLIEHVSLQCHNLKKRAAKRNWFLVWALRCKCFWRLLWKSLIFFRQVEEKKKNSSTSSLLRDTNKMSQKLWSDQCMCGTTKNVQASVLTSSPLTPHCGQFVCKDPQNSSEVPSTKVLIRSRSLSVLKIFPYSHVTKSICDSSCKFVCPNIKSEIRAHPISTVFFSLTQLNKQQLTLTSTWPKM